MKTKEEILKVAEELRIERVNKINDELVEYESAIVFDDICSFIEEEIKEQYIKSGEFSVEVDLSRNMPTSFNHRHTRRQECQDYVRDNFVKYLAEKGYKINWTNLNITIS